MGQFRLSFEVQWSDSLTILKLFLKLFLSLSRTWPRVLKDLFEPYGGPIENIGNPGFWEASEDLAQGVKGPF